MDELKGSIWIPVCPEQLGGLPTPRTAADIVGGTGKDVLTNKAKVVTKTGVNVMSFLQKLHKDGKTIVMVTHDDELAKYAERIEYLMDGKVIECKGKC